MNKLKETKATIAEGRTTAESACGIGLVEQTMLRPQRVRGAQGRTDQASVALLPAVPVPVFTGVT